MKAGYIGLGHQGGPMARRLAESDIPTTVWARRPEVSEPFADWGAKVAASPAEVGANSDVVALCVFDATGIEQVLFDDAGVLAGLAPGGIVVVHSTVSPREITAIAKRAVIKDITVLDAPVSGGGQAAAAGSLLVMLAGAESACERVLPMLSTYAGRIIKLGAVGTAQSAKLVNNAVMAANVAAALDAQRLGEMLGLDPAALLEVLRAGSGRSYSADVLAARGSLQALAGGQFVAGIGKDIALLATTLGDEVAGDSKLVATVRDLMQAVCALQQA